MEGANTGVGVVQLEYTVNGGQTWIMETDETGAACQYTGTALSPMTGVVVQRFIKNVSGKHKVYRVRATSYNAAYSRIPCYMNKHDLKAQKFHLGDDLWIVWDDDAPTNGIDGDGAGFAGHGSFYIDTSASGLVYRNQATKAMTSWATV